MRNLYCNWRMASYVLGILLLCCLAGRSQSTYAWSGKGVRTVQQSGGENRTEESTQKEALFKVLKELNRTRGVYFLFSEQSLGSRQVNNLPNSQDSIEKILGEVLKNTGLKFKKVNERTFVILTAGSSGTSADIRPVDFTQAFSLAPMTDNVFAVNPQEAITGKVTASDGAPIPGVSVTVKGTRRGTSTNGAGEFTIEAKKGDILVVSYIGYQTREVAVSGESLQITLQTSNQQLNEVVVTALGIQRKSKDLTYATQRLTNADLTTVKDANFVNSLTGKVAGVTITRSASGLGGSARVILRGNKSTQNNQPLYVIDGIPLANYSPQQPADVWGQSSGSGSSGRDGGDGISNLNPDDIESLTVLKGASGAALYGSAAANGVIVITTRSGKAGRARINISSDLTGESPMYYPDLQFKYGQGINGAASTDPTNENSWGNAVNAPDHVKPFFKTGVTTVNTVSLSGGTEKALTYFSYGNTHSTGIEPTSAYNKHNLSFRETAKFLNDRLTIDGNINLLDQKATNRPVSGLYANPLTGLYLFPRGLDFNKYKNYTVYSQQRNLDIQNWFDISPVDGSGGQDHEQNPYWLLYRGPRVDKRDRAIINLALKFKFNDWLSLQARGNVDKSWDTYDARLYAGTQAVQAAPDGRYTYVNNVNTQLYGDVLLMLNKKLGNDFSLGANLGTSINDTKLDDIDFDTKTGDPAGLFYANKFGVNFITPTALLSNQYSKHTQQQSVFGSAQIGYKGFLFVDLTGRNDWSSTFAFTPTKNSGYFYYSAGANLVLTDALNIGGPVSFGKIRVSYAKVGNSVNIYSTNPAQYTQNSQLGAQVNVKVPLPGTYLRPEDNRSFEVGTEWRFLNDRVGFDVTYYKNNNYRQYVEIPAPLGSGYSTYYLNLGNIQNTGVEATAFVTPVSTRTFKWTTTFNFAANKNRVVELSDGKVPGAGPDNIFYLTGGPGNVNMYESVIQQGGSWGDIFGSTFQRSSKDGTILVDGTGKPLQDNTFKKVGNSNPDFTLGWNNSFDIDKFTVNFLIDGRFGGKVMSVTQAVLDEYGDSKATQQARDANGVNIKATVSDATSPNDGKAWSGLLPAQAFYKGVGDRNGISEFYMYSATAVRLRELSIAYKIPAHVSWITDLRLSLIGRNLFFISKKAPFDPELSMATSNALQGIETFAQPSTRSIGASLKIGF